MTVLIDTSAWIEYLRQTPSPLVDAVAKAIREGTVATTDVVIMEVLAGTTDQASVEGWERVLDFASLLEQSPREDAETAASLYRTCRRAGETPRQLTDCLVAAIALRNDIPVLHRDRDFDVIARHTGLQVVSA